MQSTNVFLNMLSEIPLTPTNTNRWGGMERNNSTMIEFPSRYRTDGMTTRNSCVMIKYKERDALYLNVLRNNGLYVQ